MTRVTTAAIDAYLRLVRRPVDLAVSLLPGRRTGVGAAARLTVDRFDATVRTLVGAALGDPELAEQARALHERELALEQAEEAERIGDAAARVKRERKEP